MHVVGLTGGIACGKSAVSNALREAGACVLDADRLAHELAAPGGALFQAYAGHFGSEVLRNDGTLDRRAIGEIVFRNPGEREWVDRISHPILLDEIKRRLDNCEKWGHRVVILDVPLLFEAGWNVLCDEIWVVSVSMKIQLDRLMKRDNLTAEQAKARLAAQMSLEEKCSRGDVVLDNSGSIDEIGAMAKTLYRNRAALYAGESP